LILPYPPLERGWGKGGFETYSPHHFYESLRGHSRANGNPDNVSEKAENRKISGFPLEFIPTNVGTGMTFLGSKEEK
jgi:hypothetical protein